jgi:uncharacterized protein (DUF1015 family)
VAEVLPFRGLLYDPSRVVLDDVVAPPYDVISPDEAAGLRARSPYNAVAVDLPTATPGEGDPYERAATHLGAWRAAGVLRRDPRPCLYLVDETFRGPDGFERVRRGLIARLKLGAFDEGVVLPHEKTHAGPKLDRLRLWRATRTTLSPIFLLFPDDRGTVGAALGRAADEAAARPGAARSAHDRDGNLTTLTPIEGPAAEGLVAALRDERLFIADGHHRYETALAYRDERRAAGDHGADELMVYLCSMRDPGLAVFPTHRLLKGVEIPPMDEVLERLRPKFSVFGERGADADACDVMTRHLADFADHGKVFGLYFPRERACCTVELRDLAAVAHLLEEGFSPDAARLSVTVLHYLILRDALGVDPVATEGRIDYVTSPAEAFARLQSGDYTLGAFINATRVEEVRAVAERGETMPQKSTYFYPKPLTGLVFDPMDEA